MPLVVEVLSSNTSRQKIGYLKYNSRYNIAAR